MSKYGFNENEVRKTIVTQIDKDGFNKKEVFEGNIDGGSSDFDIVTMTVTGESDVNIAVPVVFEAGEANPELPAFLGSGINTYFYGNEYKIAIYKGLAYATIPEHSTGLVVDGNATLMTESGPILISGDFSIGFTSV